MCLSNSPPPAPAPVPPLAPLEPPKPMALADGAPSAARRTSGTSQLRIGARSGLLGSGLAQGAANTIADRKAQLDAQIAAAGG